MTEVQRTEFELWRNEVNEQLKSITQPIDELTSKKDRLQFRRGVLSVYDSPSREKLLKENENQMDEIRILSGSP